MATHRLLGSTGIKVPVLGLGTVKLGRDQAVKYPEQFIIPDDKAVIELLNTAKDLGINFLDTAPAYGRSEERLGQLLPGNRDQWIVMSKAGEEFINGESHFNFSSAHIAASVKRSLQRLKTDYLDILLIHSSGDDVNIIERDDVFGTLSQLKRQGYIRSFGMSTKTIDGGKLCVEHADVVMVSYSPADTECLAVIEHAEKLQKGVLIKKAFASGHLLKQAATAPKTTDEVFDFIFQQPAVSSIIVGTINPNHLKQNWQAAISV